MTLVNIQRSPVLKYDFSCLEFLVKDPPKGHIVLQGMPVFAMVGTNLGIFSIYLGRSAPQKAVVRQHPYLSI